MDASPWGCLCFGGCVVGWGGIIPPNSDLDGVPPPARNDWASGVAGGRVGALDSLVSYLKRALTVLTPQSICHGSQAKPKLTRPLGHQGWILLLSQIIPSRLAGPVADYWQATGAV